MNEQAPADIGLIGLAVMGRNLAMNLADRGHDVIVYNRTTERTTAFVEGEASGSSIVGAASYTELVDGLATPRRIIVMVKAGDVTDGVINDLSPLLDPGDIIIDGGNSHFEDTIRRTADLESKGLLFVGAGISGGEEGARHGPSIMPGGSPAAWPAVRDILQSVAARISDGTPCCDWVGPDGAGHFVKMVHNGIEYGDIQLLAEAYDLMHRGVGLDHDVMATTFHNWNQGRLNSYLVEITAAVLAYRESGLPVLEQILDAAGQKGTGRWTVESALAAGMPLTMVGEAVFARSLSALKDERVATSQLYDGPATTIIDDQASVLADLEDAVYASKIVSYAQGFMLMAAASQDRNWSIDLGGTALLWREGCIIRAAFLDDIREAYSSDPAPRDLLAAPFFRDALAAAQPGWRRTISRAVDAGVAVPAMSSALAFFDGYRSDRVPANLIQALRDYFGAHTYERVDKPRGEFFHTNWTGQGGDVSAGSYNA